MEIEDRETIAQPSKDEPEPHEVIKHSPETSPQSKEIIREIGTEIILVRDARVGKELEMHSSHLPITDLSGLALGCWQKFFKNNYGKRGSGVG
jgi:hypothetical protein